jgi:hypothetical protein
MNATEFQKIVSVTLILWCAIGLALVVFPSGILRVVTRGRLPLSTRTLWVVRILGIVNAFGALHIFWFGR